MNDDRLSVEVAVPPHASHDETNYLLRNARFKMVEALLDRLHNDRYWTIRIHEDWPTHLTERREHMAQHTPWEPLRYRLTVEVHTVETRRAVMPEYEQPDYTEWSLPRLAIDEIKRRWRKWNRDNALARSARRVDRERTGFGS